MELGEFCGGSHQCLGTDSFAEFIPPEKSDKRRNERERHDKRYKDAKREKGEIGHIDRLRVTICRTRWVAKKSTQIQDPGLMLVQAMRLVRNIDVPTQVHSREVLSRVVVNCRESLSLYVQKH